MKARWQPNERFSYGQAWQQAWECGMHVDLINIFETRVQIKMVFYDEKII